MNLGDPDTATRRLRPSGGSEPEGTVQLPPPGLQPYPEPGDYAGPDGHYVMDNITRQNQFYETQVIKQENESGYERRPLEVEQQQAYRPEMKTEMKQEAPTSFLPPEASQLKPERQQFQSRKRPYEDNRGRGYFEHREDRRWVCEAVVSLVPVGLYVCSPVPAGTFALTKRGKAELSLPSHSSPESFLHSLLLEIQLCKTFGPSHYLQVKVQTP